MNINDSCKNILLTTYKLKKMNVYIFRNIAVNEYLFIILIKTNSCYRPHSNVVKFYDSLKLN